MSAFAAKLNFDGKPADTGAMTRAANALSLYAQDCANIHTDGPLGMAHCQLRTTPEDASDWQPTVHNVSGVSLVCDARIDNRNELADKLGLAKPECAAFPDSAFILQAYFKWGERCAEHLLGDFAFAIHDKNRNRVYAARDHIGIRPFYYHLRTGPGGFFACASALKGLFACSDAPKELNEVAVADYLVWLSGDTASTFYKNIYQLPPAYWLTISPAGPLHLQRYWYPPLEPASGLKHPDDYYEAVREAMDRAVSDRLRTDGNVGITLSGGLDSSSIACLAAPKLRDRQKSLFAVSSVLAENHRGPEQDERDYIAAVARQEPNIAIHPVTLPASQSLFQNLPHVFDIHPEPFRDLFYNVTCALLSAARADDTSVLLDGYGGDFVFSSPAKGYPAELLRSGYWRRYVSEFHTAMTHRQSMRSFLSSTVKPLLPEPLWRAYRYGTKRLRQHPLSLSAIDLDFAARTGVQQRLDRYEPSRQRPDVRANEVQCLESGILAEAASFLWHVAGYYGIERRYPALDVRVLETCLAAPATLKHEKNRDRLLVREAMNGVLPNAIRQRTDKRAFWPDFHRRTLYNRRALMEMLDRYENDRPYKTYLDFAKMRDALTNLKELDNIRPRGRLGTDPTLIHAMSVSLRGLLLAQFVDALMRDGDEPRRTRFKEPADGLRT